MLEHRAVMHLVRTLSDDVAKDHYCRRIKNGACAIAKHWFSSINFNKGYDKCSTIRKQILNQCWFLLLMVY